MADSITVVLAGIPPGPNQLNRLHWGSKGKIVRQWRSDAYLAAVSARNEARASEFPWPTTRITYEFHVPSRSRRDRDNLVAACKPILDGIRDAHLIPDDSADHVILGSPVIVVTPKLSAVHVHIEQVVGPPEA
jgi:crossover junction endodeoxyribonuclease RusA